MAEKRMISDYEVIHSIDFGSRELVIGEDIDNKDGLYYLVAYQSVSHTLLILYPNMKSSILRNTVYRICSAKQKYISAMP